MALSSWVLPKLTFEPLLDKYAWLLQRHTEQDRISPPGRQHRRGLVLPMAVGCAGRATFHVPDIDGCASVLPPTGTKELLAAQRLPGQVPPFGRHDGEGVDGRGRCSGGVPRAILATVQIAP